MQRTICIVVEAANLYTFIILRALGGVQKAWRCGLPRSGVFSSPLDTKAALPATIQVKGTNIGIACHYESPYPHGKLSAAPQKGALSKSRLIAGLAAFG